MPNNVDRNVSLDVRNFASIPPYINVIGSNGLAYSYCYTGGDDGQGGATFQRGGGQGKVNVRLECDQRYTISQVNFSGDGANDFTYTPGPRNTVIRDTANDPETVKYSVVINDSVANCTVTCDPQIINRS